DFGDITCVMPGVQFNAAGATGTFHGIDFKVADKERMVVNSAKGQLFVIDALLSDDAANAKQIIANYKPVYGSIKEYFDDVNDFFLDKDAVVYDEKGNATVDFKN
ncbi:MAG: hypothetical protein IJH98_08985, partial [Solobacterium sp.]|nr:hypothetical protein [Solobacterium sp.]